MMSLMKRCQKRKFCQKRVREQVVEEVVGGGAQEQLQAEDGDGVVAVQRSLVRMMKR